MARFSAAQVRAMRALYEDGFTQAEIAEAFGTTQTHVSAIVNRKVWASVA
jgi:transcriptional regulator